ncbi:MAG: hypothetical protein EOP06_30395 [Proteobacteria bacterium]|nr:MAG: hypothetical protein EOP06_30395 [Pseudomonadota bacterium]
MFQRILSAAVIASALLFTQFASAYETTPIPVSVGDAKAQVDQYLRFDFGTARINSGGTYRNFDLQSRGPGDLWIDRITIAGSDFMATHNCPRVLRPGYFCTIQIRYMPWNVGFSNGRMYIDTNGGTITADLTGYAVSY